MNNNLLIIGAGVYGLVAKEIAEAMQCFNKIDFIDDTNTETPSGIKVVGNFNSLSTLANEYSNVFVAIGNSEVRLNLLNKIQNGTDYKIATLISPRAFVSPSASVMQGSIIEPMAVVHTGCIVEAGCIISAGAVINHASILKQGVHVDCNATVAGYTLVPEKTKIAVGEVFKQVDGAIIKLLFK